MGIEPTSSAWKAEVLPLNYTRLSQRHHIGVLPLNYLSFITCPAVLAGRSPRCELPLGSSVVTHPFNYTRL